MHGRAVYSLVPAVEPVWPDGYPPWSTLSENHPPPGHGASPGNYATVEDDVSEIIASNGRPRFAVGSALFGVFVPIDEQQVKLVSDLGFPGLELYG